MKNSEDDIIVGIDIGGSHITAALVNIKTFQILESSLTRKKIDSSAPAKEILETWLDTILFVTKGNPYRIGFAMPGPFNYELGICFIEGLNKYENLYGVYVKTYFCTRLDLPLRSILFRNDAESFLAGEIRSNRYDRNVKTLGITLGTGLGSAYSIDDITEDANLSETPFLDSVAEEYLSTRWFVSRYFQLTGMQVEDVKSMLQSEENDSIVDQIFAEFADNLYTFLSPLIKNKNVECLLIGGNITKAADRFFSKVTSCLISEKTNLKIELATLGESSAIIGAASLFSRNDQ